MNDNKSYDEVIEQITRKMHDGSHRDLTEGEFELFMEQEYLVAVEPLRHDIMNLENSLKKVHDKLASSLELNVELRSKNNKVIKELREVKSELEIHANKPDIHPLLIRLNECLHVSDSFHDNSIREVMGINERLHNERAETVSRLKVIRMILTVAAFILVLTGVGVLLS